jgi:hypothetical protein
MYQPAAYNLHSSCLLPLTTYSYYPSYTDATNQLAQGKIFLEQQDIVVNFCAQTTEGGHISLLERLRLIITLKKFVLDPSVFVAILTYFTRATEQVL